MEKKFFQKPTVYVEVVSINVTDLKRSLEFYRDFMGFRVLEEQNEKVVLTADGKNPILILEQPEGVTPKERRTAGLYHFAILLPTRRDLGAFLKHFIEQKGREIQLGAGDHFVSEALYFNDPDGNGIEIARDRPSEEWKWEDGIVEMGTVNIDAEGILAAGEGATWNGMPEETRMGHIHLHVANLEETERFYVDGLGFNIVTRYPGALFASTNGYHHHIGLNIWNGEGAKKPSAKSVGLNWFTLVFPDEAKRKATADQVEKVGGSIREEGDILITEDPAGNTIHMVIEK